MPRSAALLGKGVVRLERAAWRGILALLLLVPLGLSFVPSLPPHGYGHLWYVLPLVLRLRHPAQTKRWLLYLAAIALQTLAHPEPDLGWLGWAMLVPYLLARRCDDGAHWWRAAYAFGFFRAIVGYTWLGHVHYTGWLSVALMSGLLFAVFFEGFVRWFARIPYALRVATGWVLFEWTHSWAFGGFPWLFVGHTQYRFLPVIQIADLFGATGVSFLLVYVQAAVTDAVLARRLRVELAVAALLLGATLLYGWTRSGPDERGPGILMVQSAWPHGVKERLDIGPFDIWQNLRELTEQGIARHPEAELVVWPETMMPYPLLEDGDELSLEFFQAIRIVARQFGRPVIYGASTYTDRSRWEGYRGHNSAVLVDGDGELRKIYRKQRLVPMGEEFLPRRVLPERTCDAIFLWLVRNLPYPETCDLESGEGFVTLDAGPGLRCAPLICFEGLYADLGRGAVREGDPDLILHLVNNGWFSRSWEQRQSVASWVFRAVETRTPFFSCANAGITCAVGPDGTILGLVDRVMEPGTLFAEVPARWAPPLYLRGGHRILPAFLVLAGCLCLFRRGRRFKPKDAGDAPA